MKSHKTWPEGWDEAAEVLRALRATRQPAPEIKAQDIVESLSNGPKVEHEMKWTDTGRGYSVGCICAACAEEAREEARVKHHEPAATHLTADRLALVGVILSMLRDKLPSNAVRIAVEIEFADGGKCKMESKA